MAEPGPSDEGMGDARLPGDAGIQQSQDEPEAGLGDNDSLFGGDENEPEAADDPVLSAEELSHFASGPSGEPETQDATQDHEDNMDVGEDGHPDIDSFMGETPHDDLQPDGGIPEGYSNDSSAHDMQHNTFDIGLGDLGAKTQEPVNSMEGIEFSQAQQEHHASFNALDDAMHGEDEQAPTVQPADNVVVTEPEESLFVPESRVSPTPDRFGTSSMLGPFARPSRTPEPSVRHSSALGPFVGPSSTPEPSAGQSSSRMPPPPTGTARPATGPSASTFARIRNLQKKFNQNRVTTSRPPHRLETTPDREAYLNAILPSSTGRQPLGAISMTDAYEKADREAAAEYQKQKRHYDDIRRKKGRLPFLKDVEWMKIHSAETSRREKRKRDMRMAKDDDGAEDLFPTVYGSSHGHGENGLDEHMSDDDPAGSSRKRAPETRLSMQEAELRSMAVALQADGDLPPKKQKGVSTSDDAQKQSSGRRHGQPKGSKSKAPAKSSRSSGSHTKGGAPKLTAKEKKDLDRAVRMGTSLFNANVFDQQGGENGAEEPSFRSRNKGDALKELITSVSNEDPKSVKDDKAALLRAIRDFDGRGSVKADNGMWKVKGMHTSLKSYQIMGTAFMRRRENATVEPRGGLMADQMGLGKTLMMLANIVNDKPLHDASERTTLLVASPALIMQWSREIELHTDAGIEMMRYTSGTRIDSNRTDKVLRQHDIILTTYNEVMKSYPKNEPPIECQTAEQKIAWWKDVYEKDRGVLHRMFFHRIVLDEAQAIKNHTSRTSIACRALMARHKWALSGTPILNSLNELYSFFKFLGVPHTGSFKIFKHNYTDANDSENVERLLVRLSQFMIRRDHSDQMFGHRILTLPRATQMTHWCEFNSVERSIYEIVRQRFAKRINVAAKRGELDKSYGNALVMLLRLRQLTAHILMLQFVVQDLLEREDIERIRETVQSEATDMNSKSGATIKAIRKQLDVLAAEERKRSARKDAKGSKGSKRPSIPFDNDSAEEDTDTAELTGSSQDIENLGDSGKTFGKDFDFRPYLNSLTTGEGWEKVKKRARCCHCNKRPLHPWLSSCGHLYCNRCYEDAQLLAAEAQRMSVSCKGCGQNFSHAHEIPQDEADDIVCAAPVTRANRRRHAQEVQRIEQQDIPDDWLQLGSEGVLPSAKTIALKAQIMNWMGENPEVKVIIYTQFLAVIRILAKMCREEGWMTEEYHGKMNLTARDKAIVHFANNPEVKILLASLRCGGLGLNLTMASRVVIIDPWWNSAAEQQAFCRVFRFGQTEPTFLTRFCVRNTVDERLIEMQKKKQVEIDSVMEDDGSKVKKMSARDLMRLFGNLQDDSNGRPYILIDNPDPRGGFRADGDHEGYADEV